MVLWGDPSDRLHSLLDCRVLSYADVLAQACMRCLPRAPAAPNIPNIKRKRLLYRTTSRQQGMHACHAAGHLLRALCKDLRLQGHRQSPAFEPPRLAPAQLATIVYTSGTTGQPKVGTHAPVTCPGIFRRAR